MNKLSIDAARLAEQGDVRRAYSLGALQLKDRAPIVKTVEVEGRHYIVTSLGVVSAEVYELRHVHLYDPHRNGGGEFAGRRVTRRGVEYLLHGPFRLVAAEVAENAAVPASNGDEETVGFPPSAGEEETIPDPFVCACGAPKRRNWARCQQCASAAALALKREPLPPVAVVEVTGDLADTVNPGHFAAALPGPVVVMPAEVEAELVAHRMEELRAALLHVLRNTQGHEARWEGRRRQGMTDAELKRAIGEEFGSSQSHSRPDHTGWKVQGLTRPRLWLLPVVTLEDRPDLQGRELVDMARELLAIPQPATEAELQRAAVDAEIAAGRASVRAGDLRGGACICPGESERAYKRRSGVGPSETYCKQCGRSGKKAAAERAGWDVAQRLCDRCLLTVEVAQGMPAERAQAPAVVAREESAACDTPQGLEEECPAIVCHRCGEELHDGEEPGDEGHEVNWNHAANRAHNVEPLTCNDCRSAVATERWTGLQTAPSSPQLVPVDRSPYTEIPLGWIAKSPHNPRTVRDDDALRELADSIRARGVIQPLIVRRLPGEDPAYEIIAGERRHRAAAIAGLLHVPCIVRDETDETEIRAAQLVENLQREDLDPVAVARAYRDMAALGMTQEQIGREVGKSQETVANTLRLLALPADVLARIAGGELSARHGRALLRFRDEPAIQSLIAEFSCTTDDARKASVRYLESTPLPFAEELRACGVVPAPVVTVTPPEPTAQEHFEAIPSPSMQVAPPAPPAMAGAKGGERTYAGNGRPAADNAVEAALLEDRDLARDRAEELRARIFGEVGKWPGAMILSPRVYAVIVAAVVRYANRDVLRSVCAEMKIDFPPGFDLSDWQRPEVLDRLIRLNPPVALELAFRCVVGHELAWKPKGLPAPLCEWFAGGPDGEQAMARVEEAVA